MHQEHHACRGQALEGKKALYQPGTVWSPGKTSRCFPGAQHIQGGGRGKRGIAMQSPAFCGVSGLEMSRRTRKKTGACLQRVVGSQWPALPAEPSCRNGTRRAQCKTPGRAQGLHMHCPHQHYMNCSRAVRSFTSAANHRHPSGKYALVMFWEQPPSACPEEHKP